MLFIISLALAAAFAFFCRKPLKKHPYIFYICAAAVTLAVSCMNFRGLPPFINTYITGLFTRGAFATGLWCVVMWTGALPNGSRAMKAFMPVRGELSILAAVLTLGHNIGFGRTYFVRLFTEPGKMSSSQTAAAVMTIIMLAVMIPLTVMSFPAVRKKFKASVWKKIQRTAYIFYALMYIHVMLLFIPMAKMNRDGYYLSVIVYSIVFVSYAVCRIRKAFFQSCRKKNREYSKKLADVLCIAGFAAAAAVPCVYAVPASENNSIPAPEPSVQSAVTVPVSDTNEKAEVTKESSAAVTSSPVTSVSETGTSAVTSVSVTETTPSSETAVPENNDNPAPDESTVQEVQPQEEQPQEQPEPEIQYIYNNGTYTASAYGYDGNITVTITIENDVITSISGSTDESDPAYFNDARDYVFGQIIGSDNPNVNAYGGCTYSSNGIMSAVANALGQARR